MTILPLFIHPVVQDALEGSLASDERDALHGSAARPLFADGASPGRVASHLVRVRPAGDGWVLARLREAAQAAMQTGAPRAAAGLLGRALSEPPALADRVVVLREAARAEASAGREAACAHLEEALRCASDRRQRAEIALEVAEAYAALFRWVDAVDVIERALAELGDADEVLAARLEGELWFAVSMTRDGRRGSRRYLNVSPRVRCRGARPRRSPWRREWRWFSLGDPRTRPLPRWRKRSPGHRRARRTGTRGPRCCGAWSRRSASRWSTRRSGRWWRRSVAREAPVRSSPSQ